MNRLVLSENQIMDFDLIAQKSVQDYFDTNYLIYFLLDGEADFFVGDEEYLLKTKDFILVESCRHHGYRANGHILMGRFIISLELLSKFYDIHKMEISCNSSVGDQEQYSEFRKLLERCIGNYHGKQSGDGRSLVRLNSIYYQIVEHLISHLANYEPDEISSGENPDSERVNDIISYVHSNFKHQITLNDLAERMYLSTAYVSRYIKKKLGKNLVEYLTDIRLDSAVRDLESSDKTIARIALDNGFPNVSSFNKAFKERYQATPKRYQENYIALNKSGADDFPGGISHHLMDYMEHREDAATKYEELRRNLDADTEKYRFLTKNWNRMINIGRAVTLLRSDIQQHVIYLKRSLNVEYIRIWDLYDESLQLNIGSADGRHNFSKLDKIMDFLLDNKLRPYMELGFKPIILLDAYNSFITYQEREILFQDYIEYGRFLESMVIHFVNRYGAYEVSQWIFEQWCDPRLFSKEKADNYF